MSNKNMDVKIKDRDKETEQLRMALNMCGIYSDYIHTDLIIRVTNIYNRLKGNLSILDCTNLLAEWEKDWKDNFDRMKYEE
jgi:hypothetical protein